MVRNVGGETVGAQKQRLTRIEAVIRCMYLAAIGGNVRAAEFLCDRGWGTVPQEFDVTLPENLDEIRKRRWEQAAPAFAAAAQQTESDEP